MLGWERKARQDLPYQLAYSLAQWHKFQYDRIPILGGQQCMSTEFYSIPLPTFLGFETRLHNKLDMPQNYLKRCESATTYKISIKLSFKSKYYNL